MKSVYHNKRVLVVGAGQSGRSLVRFMLKRGATVALTDQRPAEQLPGLDELQQLPVRLDLGGHSAELFVDADLIAVSPGVPLTIPELRRAADCRVPILGEVEIAARELVQPLIAVTGTNGKSTTTSLIGAALQASGQRVFVGGNLGQPLIDACGGDYETLVVELSSFQLETIERFHPHLAVLLNLSPDHLDRYPDLESYYQAKMQLFRNLQSGDQVLLNADDPEVCRLTAGLQAEKIWFSAHGRMVDGMTRLGERLHWNRQGEHLEFSLRDFRLAGEHNIENAMAALSAALLKGCPSSTAWSSICAFPGLAHRMQLVRHRQGVDWFNDSKGTNVGSVIKSLAGLPAGIVLIAGGKDKGGDYAPLRPAVAQKVRHLLLLGEASPRMAEELAGTTDIRQVADLETAVEQASKLARPGDRVLLSPACSSFDMFVDYRARGEEFVRLVNQLPESEAVS